MRTGTIRRTVTFARAARCYWFEVFPFARRELHEWRRQAEAIPEPALRRDALLALGAKSGNAEGLAAFAVLAPRAERRAVIRAVVAYQTALDYLDNVTERPVHSHAERLKLNGALEVAVDSELSLETYREETGQRADHEYLIALVEACRSSLGGLPSYSSAVSTLRRRARLGAESQAMNHSLQFGADEREMVRWAHELTRASSLEGELQWWEVFAAGASTPALGALSALAAKPGGDEGDFLAVERAYFPWVNTLTLCSTAWSTSTKTPRSSVTSSATARPRQPRSDWRRSLLAPVRGFASSPALSSTSSFWRRWAACISHNLPPGMGIAA